MKQEWLKIALDAAALPAAFYSGNRKILRAKTWTFRKIKKDLTLADAGYSKQKLTHLIRGYVHDTSRGIAVDLWSERLRKERYGSVSFHCFNHLIKGTDMDPAEWLRQKRAGVQLTSKRASVMGPCIQAVSLTLMPDKSTAIDCFYRTTELFKKFPADLVFIRDVLLQPFDFTNAPLSSITFHFANVTCHPMYFVTVIPHLPNPIDTLEHLKKVDRFFHDWIVKWTSRYICNEYNRGIQKFSQALRVRGDALARIEPKVLTRLQAYCRKNHPGFRGDPKDDGDEE